MGYALNDNQPCMTPTLPPSTLDVWSDHQQQPPNLHEDYMWACIQWLFAHYSSLSMCSIFFPSCSLPPSLPPSLIAPFPTSPLAFSFLVTNGNADATRSIIGVRNAAQMYENTHNLRRDWRFLGTRPFIAKDHNPRLIQPDSPITKNLSSLDAPSPGAHLSY